MLYFYDDNTPTKIIFNKVKCNEVLYGITLLLKCIFIIDEFPATLVYGIKK